VIHVIVERCHDFSKLLRVLTSSQNESLPELTLTPPDEKSIPPGQIKKQQVKEEKVFPEGRNFR
jgi:error-prone DNA polymerase